MERTGITTFSAQVLFKQRTSQFHLNKEGGLWTGSAH